MDAQRVFKVAAIVNAVNIMEVLVTITPTWKHYCNGCRFLNLTKQRCDLFNHRQDISITTGRPLRLLVCKKHTIKQEKQNVKERS